MQKIIAGLICAILIPLAGCADKSNDGSPTPPDFGHGISHVTFGKFLTRSTDYGEDPGTEVFCSYAPKYQMYMVRMSQTNTDDGVEIAVFGRPEDFQTLNADFHDPVTVILGEFSTEPTMAKFGQHHEMCTTTLHAADGSWTGAFDCPGLTNDRGDLLQVTGSFTCTLWVDTCSQ